MNTNNKSFNLSDLNGRPLRLLIGGFPCTKFAICQKKDRETQPYEGEGWELFHNYLLAKEKFKPDFFLAENNKSIAEAIKNEVTKLLGSGYITINSALVSAQNRQRCYWTNIPGIEQPKDRGILLKNILETGIVDREKSYYLKHQAGNSKDYLKKHHTQVAFEPVEIIEDESLCVAQRGRYNEQGKVIQHYEPRLDGKTNTLTTVQKDNMVISPIRIGTIENTAKNQDFDSQQYRVYSPEGKSVTICGQGGGVGAKTGLYAIPVRLTNTNSLEDKADCLRATYYKTGQRNFVKNESEHLGYQGVIEEIKLLSEKEMEYMLRDTKDGRNHFDFDHHSTTIKDKSSCVVSNFYKGVPYNVLCESVDPDGNLNIDGKFIYTVKDGEITYKGNKYHINLPDGFYIIRKLTPVECERLQTMPDGYTELGIDENGKQIKVSASQRYKQLGNGWTAEVIIHILSYLDQFNIPHDYPIEVLSMYDGIGTGRYCLEKLGYTNILYKAYEIDSHAISVARKNYSDIIHCGDAFKLRNDDWKY